MYHTLDKIYKNFLFKFIHYKQNMLKFIQTYFKVHPLHQIIQIESEFHFHFDQKRPLPCKIVGQWFKATCTKRTWMLASVAFERTLSLPLQDTDDVLWSPTWHTFDETSASDISGLARGAIAKFPLLPPLLLMAVARIAACVGGLFAGKSVSDPPPLPRPCCCCCCCCSAYSKAANNRGHLPWWILLSGRADNRKSERVTKHVEIVWNSTMSIITDGSRGEKKNRSGEILIPASIKVMF